MTRLIALLEAKRKDVVDGSRPEIKVIRFVRLDPMSGSGHVDLFHVKRGDIHHVVTKDSAFGMLKLGHYASGKRAAVAKAFERTLANFRDATDSGFGHTPMEVIATKMDAAADKAIRLIGDSNWGIQHWDLGLDADSESAEADNFHKILKPQIDRWKGGFNSIAARRHSYWPVFHRMVVEAVRKLKGQRVVLYRAIFGQPALDIIRGEPLVTRRFASWTDDPQEARTFLRGHSGGHKMGRDTPWVIVKKSFKPTDIAFAPVELPEYVPGSNVLERFKWESEFVPETKRGSIPRRQFAIYAKTKGKAFR
jgi:hypothetical protein